MSEIYVHDDQVGPFARMAFEECAIRVDMGDRREAVPVRALSTAWGAHVGDTSSIRAVPVVLLMPVYHKIRILYDDIVQVAENFHEFLISMPPLNALFDANRFEWDIYLTTADDLKADLRHCAQLHETQRVHWVTQLMPCFLWRATVRADEQRVLDILFDATDIHTSDGVHAVVCYEKRLDTALTLMASNPDGKELDRFPGALRILRGLQRQQRQLASAA